MDNVNDTYFDGHYKDMWRTIIPEGLTEKETEFMLQYFNLQPGSKVLDLMCGYGRHALALGRKGIAVTAVDNLGDYVEEIKTIVKNEGLPVQVIKADVIQYRSTDIFELAICMGNSFNFFDRKDGIALLKSICAQLKKGGSLLVNTWSLAEIAIKQHIEKSWSVINGLKFLTDSVYLFQPTRIESETTILLPDGNSEVKKAVDYIFSVAEMEAMLEESGFTLKEIYSIPGRRKFKLGEPRAYIVAEKK